MTTMILVSLFFLLFLIFPAHPSSFRYFFYRSIYYDAFCLLPQRRRRYFTSPSKPTATNCCFLLSTHTVYIYIYSVFFFSFRWYLKLAIIIIVLSQCVCMFSIAIENISNVMFHRLRMEAKNEWLSQPQLEELKGRKKCNVEKNIVGRRTK